MIKSLSALLLTAAAWAAAPVTISGTPSVPAIRAQILEAAHTGSTVTWEEACCYSEADEAEVRDFAKAQDVKLAVIRPKTRTPYSRIASDYNPSFTRLHIEQWQGEGSFEKLLALPRQVIATDWYTNETTPLQFALAYDGKDIWFLAEHAPVAEAKKGAAPAAPATPATAAAATKKPARPAAKPASTFTEDAHRADHTLLGFADYQANLFWEIDLTPDGKWWCCYYDKVHNAAPKPGLDGTVETKTLHTEGGDIAMMRLPLGALTAINPEFARGSVSGVFGKTRMTTGRDITGQPDLLRPSGWPFTSMFVPF